MLKGESVSISPNPARIEICESSLTAYPLEKWVNQETARTWTLASQFGKLIADAGEMAERLKARAC